MTQVVVTDTNKTVVIGTQEQTTVVTVQQQAPRTIVTGLMGPPGAATLSAANDVDLSNLAEGSILVYNPISEKWTATTILEQQVFEGGHF